MRRRKTAIVALNLVIKCCYYSMQSYTVLLQKYNKTTRNRR